MGRLQSCGTVHGQGSSLMTHTEGPELWHLRRQMGPMDMAGMMMAHSSSDMMMAPSSSDMMMGMAPGMSMAGMAMAPGLDTAPAMAPEIAAVGQKIPLSKVPMLATPASCPSVSSYSVSPGGRRLQQSGPMNHTIKLSKDTVHWG